LFRPTNVIINASQSGKMTSGIHFFITFIFYLTIYNNKSYKKASKLTFIFLIDLFKMWLEEAYFPNIGSDSVLFIESWTGHCSNIISDLTSPGKHITTIPITNNIERKLLGKTIRRLWI